MLQLHFPTRSRLFLALAGVHVCVLAVATELHVHNPHNVAIKEVHMVISSHFDAGCKTPGCGKVHPGEPNVCAKVGAGNAHGATDPFGTGEPWAYHIVNRYFDQFFADAIALAEQGRSTAGTYNYTYMTQSWLVSLYLDCENAGLKSWAGNGAPNTGTPVLHCPNASSVAALKKALQRGDIFMHSFPHDGEASYYPDSSLFESALRMAETLAKELGIPAPVAVSQRDVPGWTRAALPLLKKHGIIGLSFGAGTPPGKPDVPPLCVWRDEANDAEVILTYSTAYGNINDVFVLPNGVALTAAWAGDNTGPPPFAVVKGFYDTLRKRYPAANVHASTFDAFFKVANQPHIKSQLPVVTAEIGDGWLYGVPSDPLKNAQFREATRQRTACITTGACDPQSAAIRAFDRLLVKVPEHTWGVAQSWFLPDYVNYTNAQFDRARAQQSNGFVKDNTHHADYNSTVNSWLEQRTYVTQAPALLQGEYPALAASITKALHDIAHVSAPSTAGMTEIKAPVNKELTCGQWTLAFGEGAGLTILKQTPAQSKNWASDAHPIGQFLYQTFTAADYNMFLKDFGARIGDKGVWPEHTVTKFMNYTKGTSDMDCPSNFCRPNVSSAQPIHRELAPTLNGVWQAAVTDQGCVLVTRATLPVEAQTEAGAPTEIVTKITVLGSAIEWEVNWLGKRPTRLPESMFFSFTPDVEAAGWELQVLGTKMDPTDTLGEVGDTPLDSVYGGSPHLRGVEAARWAGAEGNFTLTSKDVPILCMGQASPFDTPRTKAPDMSKGVHWNIFQNIWNTNYVLWYPFDDADRDAVSRFRMEFD